MVSAVVVVLDEGLDLGLKVAGQEVVFQQDAVLQGLVPAFNLALSLGMRARFPLLAFPFFTHEQWTCNGFVPVTYLIMPPLFRTREG